jgi:rhodanese-related sulfurtransferase
MKWRYWQEDLAWAAFILGLAVFMGLIQHWPLVKVSWQGELQAHLEAARTRERQVRFQGVKTLNLAQTYALHQQGAALFLDARPADEYRELHIAGAMNLPEDSLEASGAAPEGIAKDREIVVYCSQESCNAALKTAEILEKLGYTKVAAFMGGFKAWDEAGYPAETSQ